MKTTTQDTLRNYRDISEFEKCIEQLLKITEKNLIQSGEEIEIQLFDVKNKIKEILFNFENNKLNIMKSQINLQNIGYNLQ